MFAFLAFIAFLLAFLTAIGATDINYGALIAAGLALLAIHVFWPVGPALPSWPRRR